MATLAATPCRGERGRLETLLAHPRCYGVAAVAKLVFDVFFRPRRQHGLGEIRIEFPDAKLIAMSGGEPQDPRSDLPIAWAYGAVCSLGKPFSRATLLAAVDGVLCTPPGKPC